MNDPVIADAFTTADMFPMTPAERKRRLDQEVIRMDRESMLFNAEKRGKAEGIAQGIAQGRQQGMELGKEEGRLEERQNIAEGLIGTGLRVEEIAKICSMSSEAVRSFAKEQELSC